MRLYLAVLGLLFASVIFVGEASAHGLDDHTSAVPVQNEIDEERPASESSECCVLHAANCSLGSLLVASDQLVGYAPVTEFGIFTSLNELRVGLRRSPPNPPPIMETV